MKQEILNRIQQLGGNIENVKGQSLKEDLMAIHFNTVLYPKPEDTPWQIAKNTEPIYGMKKFVEENKKLFEQDKKTFYDKIINHYYRVTKEGFGQMFYIGESFTPFKEGTPDFDEWNSDFEGWNIEPEDDYSIDLNEVVKVTKDLKPDFVQIFYSYSYPDHFYVCLSDPDPENPTVFGTDHEVFFSEVSNEGKLEEFFNQFMTKEELIEIIEKALG